LFGHLEAFLSDGTVAEEPDLTLVTKKYVVVGGIKYKILPLVNHPEDYVAQPVPSYGLPVSSPARPINDAQVTYIGGQSRMHQPPPRLGGFGGGHFPPAPSARQTSSDAGNVSLGQ
jgi:hypothetical protein